jgi:pyruvate dehydrogenase E1 component alpha subunit
MTYQEEITDMRIAKNELIDMLDRMLLIRYFDEAAGDLYGNKEVAGGTHLYIGEEAVAVGAVSALRADDYITSTHRGHGHCIAKGADPKLMMAELLGKSDGICRGKGGSLHIADVETGNLGASGIVGGGIPIAVGAGLASELNETGRVVLCFFGDGAANTGAFHEAVNLAAVWKLPVVFLCENNLYGMSVPLAEASAVSDMSVRSAAYGIPGDSVDGNDVLAVRKSVQKAVNKARKGGGPSIIQCATYRWRGHAASDPGTYRTREEVAEWKAKCPIKRYKAHLLAEKVIDEVGYDNADERAKQAIDAAVEFARKSPYPSPDELFTDVFAPAYTVVDQPTTKATRNIPYWKALNEALSEEMTRDKSVVVFGEDVAFYGGAFGATRDLYKLFPGRVRNTPISEAAIAGAAVGASLCGLRPVAEIMYMDFMPIAADQIVNQAAKIRYMFGGKPKLPIVYRTQGGGGKSIAAQHSQSLEAWFAHTPGLKIAMPSTPYDAKGLLKTAIREDNPVLFVEHKLLYRLEGEVPEEEYLIPFGVADIKRAGSDITVVATSRMVLLALEAAELLSADGIDVEVIDPRTIVPLDIETIVRSVKKTGRVLIVHEACKTGGVGAEIGMQIQEAAFDYLDAPVMRIGGLDVPMPCSPALEKLVIPSTESIAAGVKSIIGPGTRTERSLSIP